MAKISTKHTYVDSGGRNLDKIKTLLYYPAQQMNNIYINNIIHVSMHLHHLQGAVTLCFAKVTKLLKLQLNKSSRLKCSRDHCCMIKYNL